MQEKKEHFSSTEMIDALCHQVYIDDIDPEKNSAQISVVENLFNLKPKRLQENNRIIVCEGFLKKVCRKQPKEKHFFLFNDMLLYGNIILKYKRLSKPKFIELKSAAVEDVDESLALQYAFIVKSPKKSFSLCAYTKREKNLWMAHIKKCILRLRGNDNDSDQNCLYSPVWVPDKEAEKCMVCKTVEFGLIQRRHHCRHCGKVVCNDCSTQRWLLSYQSNKKRRVCDECFRQLKSSKSQSQAEKDSPFVADTSSDDETSGSDFH